MEPTDFYERLADILDVDEVKPDDVLREFSEWDSLTVLAVLAMAHSRYGVAIGSEEMRSVVTSSDLARLLAAKLR